MPIPPAVPAAAFPEARRGNAWDDWEEVSERGPVKPSTSIRALTFRDAQAYTRDEQPQADNVRLWQQALSRFSPPFSPNPIAHSAGLTQQQHIPTDILDTAICVERDSATSGSGTFRCHHQRSARLEDPETTDRGFDRNARQRESIREQRRSSAD